MSKTKSEAIEFTKERARSEIWFSRSAIIYIITNVFDDNRKRRSTDVLRESLRVYESTIAHANEVRTLQKVDFFIFDT